MLSAGACMSWRVIALFVGRIVLSHLLRKDFLFLASDVFLLS